MVEFLLVIVVIFSLMFAFLQLAWALAWGHYVHYATFMTARAYMSSNATQALQLENAAAVMRAMLKKSGTDEDLLGKIATAETGDSRDIKGAEPVPGGFIGAHPFAATSGLTTRYFSWAEGAQYNFKFKLFIIPFATWLKKDVGKSIKIGARGQEISQNWTGDIGLASDSFLGREQSDEECREYMRMLSQSYRRGDGADFLFDNGC